MAKEVVGVAPPLKWVGGKRWVAEKVRSLFPEKIAGRYYEPFLGGGAVFFSLRPEQLPLFDEQGRQHVPAVRARCADLSPDLVHFYLALRDDTERVMDHARWLRQAYNTRETGDGKAGFYLGIRGEFNRGRGELYPPLVNVDQAARFLFLNKTGFNGLLRYNRRGEMNTPHGAYKNPTIFDPANLRAAALALRGVDLRVEDFEECVLDAGPGDVAYFDPVHAARDEKRRGATFTGYTGKGWTADDDRRVSAVFWSLARRGVRVVMSQADTPRARELLQQEGGELWSSAHVEVVMRPGTVSSKGSGRAAVPELLVAAGGAR